MNQHPHDELLHGELDGTLTAVEAERLREQLAADAELRERAAGLQRVKELVDGIGLAEPPAGFADLVMAEIAANAAERPTWLRRCANLATASRHQLFGRRVRHWGQSNDSGDTPRWTTGMAGGGENVAKKTLWAVAGVAVATILVVVYFNGTRSVEQGAEGTIGAADRYRGTQPTSVAAKEGNAQKFLQSDVFDKLLKDKNVRALMADKEACALLASPEVQAALAQSDVQNALQDDSVDLALRSSSLRAAMEDAEVEAALHNDKLHAALQDSAVAAALRSSRVRTALADESVQASLREASAFLAVADADAIDAALKGEKAGANLAGRDEFEAALQNANFRAMMADGDFEAALKNANFRAMMADGEFEAALKSSSFRALMADEGFEAALKNANFRSLFASDAFELALQRDKFRSLIADEGFQAALRQGPMMKLIAEDMDFQAALRDSGAMESALKAVAR